MTGPDSSTIAERLANFAVTAYREPGSIPEAIRAQARLRLLDNIGCASVALRVAPARRIAELAVAMGQGRCHVPGARATTSPTAAALATGTMIQAFEMNDLGVYVHPGACIVPACLGAAEEAGGPISGASLLAAMIVAYEITIRISEQIGPGPELDIGWHTPPFHGAIGAAAGAALILGLDREAVTQAMVIAADIAGGGLMLARLGTDIKRLHCGRGAEAGILAALLAARGIRSRVDTLEHPDWGYCRTMMASADTGDLAALLDGAGERYVAFSRTAMKYYPVGAEVIGVIDNITRLRREHGLSPEDVERIEVGTPRFFHIAAVHSFPASVSEIHFSVEYGAAMAMTYDVRPIDEDSDLPNSWMKGYTEAAVKALSRRIEHVVDEALDRHNPYGIDSYVRIVTVDGRELTAQTTYVRDAESAGTMSFAAMTRARVAAKFAALSTPAIGEEAALRTTELIEGIETMEDVAAFWALFCDTAAEGRHMLA